MKRKLTILSNFNVIDPTVNNSFVYMFHFFKKNCNKIFNQNNHNSITPEAQQKMIDSQELHSLQPLSDSAPISKSDWLNKFIDACGNGLFNNVE